MVQKESVQPPRPRGRPRGYDSKAAIVQATDIFWRAGYAGTSLNDVASATGMNKPSLYAAFGDKHALYLEALSGYWQRTFADMRAALEGERPLKEALMQVYEGALKVYLSGDSEARGCFVVGTAVTEAATDREIRASLADGIHTLDSDFEKRFRVAREKDELKPDADPAVLAMLATATMHTIAIRARAGVSRGELKKLARKAIGVLCGDLGA